MYSTSVRLDSKTKDDLKKIKIKYDHKSYNETIIFLTKKELERK